MCGITGWVDFFERFYRGRNATAATGTGLGLAIARWIATQHNGTIEVLDTQGEGSRFSLRLPLATSGDVGLHGVFTQATGGS